MSSRSVMIYGNSGCTKTSQSYHLIKWILAQPGNEGKHFRMIYADGGGYAPFADSGMIDNKQVKLFDFSYRKHALADYRKLSEGYWPRLTSKGEEYFKKDSNCVTSDWSKVAGYLIEGMSSVAETLKTHISNQTEGVGFKESWKYEEDGETLTGLQMGHYGLIQKEVYQAHMRGFKTLPVPWLIYTSLLGKGEDKQSRETVYGPQLAGSASTSQIPSWFMDCLHLDTAKWNGADGAVKDGMVAWFVKHNDATTDVPYLCKARIMPELYPKLLKHFPYGFVPLGYERGVDVYFERLESLRRENVE